MITLTTGLDPGTGAPTDTLTGSFALKFMGRHAEEPFPANATAAQCQAAFESHAAISRARCFRTQLDADTGAASYQVALEFEPDPIENNVFVHTGDPALVLFNCDASSARSSAGDAVNCTLDNADMSLSVSNATTFDGLGNDVILDGGLAEAGRVPGTLDVAVLISNATTVPNKFRVGLLRQVNQTVEYDIPAGGGEIDVQALDGNITITLSFGSHVGHALNALWVVRVGNRTVPEVVRAPTVKEHDLCSNNGICDFKEGTCSCFGDSTGSRCEFVPTAEVFDSDATYLEVFVEDPGFEGPAFVLETQRAESADFNFIQVIAN